MAGVSVGTTQRRSEDEDGAASLSGPSARIGNPALKLTREELIFRDLLRLFGVRNKRILPTEVLRDRDKPQGEKSFELKVGINPGEGGLLARAEIEVYERGVRTHFFTADFLKVPLDASKNTCSVVDLLSDLRGRRCRLCPYEITRIVLSNLARVWEGIGLKFADFTISKTQPFTSTLADDKRALIAQLPPFHQALLDVLGSRDIIQADQRLRFISGPDIPKPSPRPRSPKKKYIQLPHVRPALAIEVFLSGPGFQNVDFFHCNSEQVFKGGIALVCSERDMKKLKTPKELRF